MPSLSFVLPHWLYWGILAVFPLVAIFFVNRQRSRGVPKGASVFVAYMFWLCSGFMGLHRFYLRSNWGFVFIPVFLLILHTTDVIRDRREDVSRTRAAVATTHSAVEHAVVPSDVTATPEMADRLAKAKAAETAAKSDYDTAQGNLAHWYDYSRWLAILMAAMLVGDAILLPWIVRATNAREAAERANAPAEVVVPDVGAIGTGEDPTLGLHTRFTDAIEAVNIRVGEFVAYWAVISVFGYYYEVIARFAFNSPTNWLHESMFLMYGMQYMLAGAYAYREDQHVRVDVFYTKFSPRGKAIADIITSVFFFIFVGTLLWTSWKFASDAVDLGEVSFTEWGVQYWPVKLSMPIGAALLLLQGVSKLIKDITILTRGKA
jgi:TRAP-type mannitol/chloroaromatic compound transport system permease small subunit/TM2 domain-containing membrane protein YozV